MANYKKLNLQSIKSTRRTQRLYATERELEKYSVPDVEELTRDELRVYQYFKADSGATYKTFIEGYRGTQKRDRTNALKSMVRKGHLHQIGDGWFISVTRRYMMRVKQRHELRRKLESDVAELNELLDTTFHGWEKLLFVAETIIDRVLTLTKDQYE